jgi:hypothetical protein
MRSRLVIGLVLLVIAAGCGKKDNPMNPGGGGTGGGGGGVQLPNGSMSATFNGSSWNATVLSATSPVGNSGILGIGANDAAGRGIAFALFASAPGTYNNATSVGMNFIITEGLQFFQSSAAVAGTSGTVTLTSITANRVVGTFQCVATATPGTGSSGSRTITNGTFDVTF